MAKFKNYSNENQKLGEFIKLLDAIMYTVKQISPK